MSGGLRIRVLGGFRAEIGGRPVAAEAWRRSGAAALVKLLAVTPGHRMHRDELIDVLWPELDQAAGGRRLTKALHFARRALGAEHVRLRDDLLSLGADELWVDVEAFEAAARQGETERALALYTGELLPENRFDGWAELRRAQARADAVRLLLDQGVERAGRGDNRGAFASFEHLLTIDPLHEEAHAHLMRLAVRDGQRHVAVRWYGRLVEHLREEMGVAPNADLQRLYADIVSGPPAAGPPAESPAGEEVAPAEPAAAVSEERKLVTVLAADLRGARGARGDPDPERARREAATWTDVLCEAVGRWGGTAERLVGGGVLAVFGYPAAREDHAARALWAAAEILRRLPVPVRLGIDTGEVIAPAGESASLSGLGGDVLDLAACLRETAQPRTVLVSDRARLAAYGEFRFGPAVRVGGSTARRLLGADWAVGQARPESEPPMVGREDETRVVLTVIDEAAASGRPRLLTVVAAAGVGKSRLIREVVSAALERRPEIRVLRGRCLPVGDGVTYWALGEILRDACGIAIGESGEVAQRKLATRLGQLLSPLQSAVDETVFALAATRMRGGGSGRPSAPVAYPSMSASRRSRRRCAAATVSGRWSANPAVAPSSPRSRPTGCTPARHSRLRSRPRGSSVPASCSDGSALALSGSATSSMVRSSEPIRSSHQRMSRPR
jgi:DNA-binding SARP family transcriptional activator